MKLIIAGSRSITQYSILRGAILLSGLWEKHGRGIVVISGKAKGVDTLGEEFAAKAGCEVIGKPAEWGDTTAPGARIRHNSRGPYNSLAGMWRNEEMANEADAALILWDGKSTGSLDMVHKMLMQTKPVYLYATKISVDAFHSLEAKGCIMLISAPTSGGIG